MAKDLGNFFAKFCFLIVIFFCISLVSAEIRINEVELNPAGSSDNGNEWIELYSDKEVIIEDWKIENGKGKNMTFNASFSGYYIIIGSYQFLTDDNNTFKLKDNEGNLVFSTIALSDKKNNNNSWQYCKGEWVFAESTRNADNFCPADQEKNNNQEESKINAEEENDTENEQDAKNDTKPNLNRTVVTTPKDVVEKTPETIVLGESEDIKSQNKVIYESKISKIKEYSLWVFSIVCVIVIILLLIDRRKHLGIE